MYFKKKWIVKSGIALWQHEGATGQILSVFENGLGGEGVVRGSAKYLLLNNFYKTINLCELALVVGKSRIC